MTLLDKSLKLALLCGVALLTACPPADKDETGVESDADTDADSDTDTDADTDADVETGISYLALLGNITTAGDASSGYTFASGNFGFGAYGVVNDAYVCTNIGTITEEADAAPEGCPDCEWTFNLSPLTDSVAEGDYCDSMIEAGGFVSGALDGYFDFSWGFTPSYNYYDTEGNLYPLEETIFVNSGKGWNFFMFNWPDGGFEQVAGDASSVDFGRIITSYGEPAYSYYYYR